jgi:hypothetical protein
MRAKWIGGGATLAAAVVALACGEGRAIFVVDVFSFMTGGTDTVHYTIPGGVVGGANNTPMKVTLLGGLGKSDVDTVQIIGAASLVNNTGSGTVAFQIFFAADSASTYIGAPVLSAGGSVSPGATTPIGSQATLVGDTIFKHQTVWVGVRAAVNANAGPAVDGKVKLTALTLRIVLKDKLL